MAEQKDIDYAEDEINKIYQNKNKKISLKRKDEMDLLKNELVKIFESVLKITDLTRRNRLNALFRKAYGLCYKLPFIKRSHPSYQEMATQMTNAGIFMEMRKDERLDDIEKNEETPRSFVTSHQSPA
jgi:hypothetical protein